MRTSSEGLIVEDPSGLLMSPHTAHRAKQMQVLDLERNILQVLKKLAAYYYFSSSRLVFNYYDDNFVFLLAFLSSLQAKGLRTALCVRIVHTKSFGDTVVYVLRVEDVESGLQWVVQV